MDTRISDENPYRYDRYGFAWQHVPCGGEAHLDFGCHDGSFLGSLGSKGIARLVGVDISQAAVSKGHQQFADLEIVYICQTVPLPFADDQFDSITILDVLEHVWEQGALLDELNRVLKDDGILIVTVPGQHIFSFLDRGNFKFRFPRLHRAYYCRKYSQEEYERRYVCNPDGLVGDISAEKRWHEHFSRAKLGKLLNESGFEVVSFDGNGFFGRIIGNINVLVRGIKSLQPVIGRIGAFDARMFKSNNLFCTARKRKFLHGRQ